MLYAVIHGRRDMQPNPRHYPDGLEQIASLARTYPFLANISYIVSGTGVRFIEIHEVLIKEIPAIAGVPFERNKLLGGPEARDDSTHEILFPDGQRCPEEEFDRATYVPVDKVWHFLRNLPDNTLLCTGRDFMWRLNTQRVKSFTAQIFGIDPIGETIQKLT